MAELVRFHGQVATVNGSAATIDDDSTVTSAGITNTGTISTSGAITILGSGNGIYLYDDSGNLCLLSLYDLGDGNSDPQVTRI